MAPSTEPCGTPRSKLWSLERVPFIGTCCVRFFRYDDICSIALSLILNVVFSLARKIL